MEKRPIHTRAEADNMPSAGSRPGDTLPAAPVTLQSCLEALPLSTRALNALHQLGCQTIEDTLRYDFRQPHPRLGLKTRQEVMDALAAHHFIPPVPPPEAPEVRQLARVLDRLREQMESSMRRWEVQLSGLEEKIRKLTDRV